jgi:DNA-directed RNA polymerase specialized sigma24 family protein
MSLEPVASAAQYSPDTRYRTPGTPTVSRTSPIRDVAMLADSLGPGEALPARSPREFATTRWSLILDARGAPEDARLALQDICTAYRLPVLAYIRRHGPHGEAEDLAQSFFTRLLETRWDANADPARGRFRAFLLTALKRFLANEAAATAACKRGGQQQRVDFEDVAAQLTAPDAQSPEQVFQRAWAMTVLERAHARLRDEAVAAGKQALFAALAPHLGEAVDNSVYRRLGEDLGMRANTIAVAMHRLRQRLRECVWDELAEQTDSEAGLHDELRLLRSALLGGAAAEGAHGED